MRVWIHGSFLSGTKHFRRSMGASKSREVARYLGKGQKLCKDLDDRRCRRVAGEAGG